MAVLIILDSVTPQIDDFGPAQDMQIVGNMVTGPNYGVYIVSL